MQIDGDEFVLEDNKVREHRGWASDRVFRNLDDRNTRHVDRGRALALSLRVQLSLFRAVRGGSAASGRVQERVRDRLLFVFEDVLGEGAVLDFVMR